MTKMKRRPWSAADAELLRRHYADTENTVLAQALGRTVEQLYSKATSMGLHKSRELIAAVARHRIVNVPTHGARGTQFRPGHEPANKGLRRPGYAPGNMSRSQFKPGNRPHTWVPVGSFRVVEGDVLEQKYSDDPGPPGARWRAYARLVWEAANGPLPPGHLVVFLPGRHTTDPALVTLDAVECISRVEHIRRHTIHHMPPELADVARLRGRITRAINERAKDEAP